MASHESRNDAPAKPVNDSIDELLDGLPAEPMLPKKRARPIDQTGPSSQNRRADDKVIVRDETDPRERARVEAEAARRHSSTFGTSFLGPNATKQRVIAFVVMMCAVLGIYAVVRSLRKNASAQSMQNTSNLAVPTAASTAPPLPTAESIPPVPTMAPTTTATNVAAAPSVTAVATPHHPRLHADGHAVPSSSVVSPIPWATSRSGS